jgi:transposase
MEGHSKPPGLGANALCPERPTHPRDLTQFASSIFNAKGPEGLLTGRAPGAPARLNDQQREALQAIVDQGPIPAIHGVVRWRLVDLILWLWEEFRLSISKQTLSRELRAMGYRKLSARPRHHAKSETAVAAFKN